MNSKSSHTFPKSYSCIHFNFLSCFCGISNEEKSIFFLQKPFVQSPQSFRIFDLLSSILELLYLFSLEGTCGGLVADPLHSIIPARTVFEPIFHFPCWFKGKKTKKTLPNKSLRALVHTPLPAHPIPALLPWCSIAHRLLFSFLPSSPLPQFDCIITKHSNVRLLYMFCGDSDW